MGAWGEGPWATECRVLRRARAGRQGRAPQQDRGANNAARPGPQENLPARSAFVRRGRAARRALRRPTVQVAEPAERGAQI